MDYKVYTLPVTIDGRSVIVAIETKGDVMDAVEFAKRLEADPTKDFDYRTGTGVVGGYLNYRSVPACEMNAEENAAL
jgi:hypothetical protein